MGIERTAVSTKLSPENMEFIDEWAQSLKPLDVSASSLVDLSVRIVRNLVATGKLSREPKALQDFLGNVRNGSNEGNGSKR